MTTFLSPGIVFHGFYWQLDPTLDQAVRKQNFHKFHILQSIYNNYQQNKKQTMDCFDMDLIWFNSAKKGVLKSKNILKNQ